MKVLTIAEIGQAHDGSLGIAHSFIDALSNSGVDVVKFQTHIAEAESSEHEPFRVNFSYQDKTRYDYWKRMEFSFDEWKGLKKHCEDAGLEFMSTPSSIKAVDLLENLNVKRYKVGSGDVSNNLLLKKLALTNKPIIISSGMSSIDEIRTAINEFSNTKNNISLLQCTSKYPTSPEDIGLNLIAKYKSIFNCKVGYSDHSGNIYACLAAVALGADLIEFHVTFDNQMFGPDSKSSISLNHLEKFIEGIAHINSIIDNPCDDQLSDEILKMKSIFEKSIAINKDLHKGSIISFDDLESKKPPGMGINVQDYQKIIGKKLLKDKNKYDFLNYDDLI